MELPDQVESVSLVDDRGRSLGWGRLVHVVLWILGIVTVSIALVGMIQRKDEPLGEHLVALFAGFLYLGAALGLTHNGRRMRVVALVCISASLAGPIVLGLLEVGTEAEPILRAWSPWTQFGAQTWFMSLVFPIGGLFWLWWSNPRRIVELAEGIKR